MDNILPWTRRFVWQLVKLPKVAGRYPTYSSLGSYFSVVFSKYYIPNVVTASGNYSCLTPIFLISYLIFSYKLIIININFHCLSIVYTYTRLRAVHIPEPDSVRRGGPIYQIRRAAQRLTLALLICLWPQESDWLPVLIKQTTASCLFTKPKRPKLLVTLKRFRVVCRNWKLSFPCILEPKALQNL